MGRVDLIYGGFPCQDLSVAGKRAGLSGERSGLWHEFHRILREVRPRWCVIENVPGLLSSNKGADFAVILEGLEELGYGVAWRILDARYFGVPQRRRRVIIVGCLAGAASAAQVLAVTEGCDGHPEAGGKAGKGATGRAPAGPGSTGIAYTLPASSRGTGDGHGNAWNSNYVTSQVVDSQASVGAPRPLQTSQQHGDAESENFVIAPTFSLRSDASRDGISRNAGPDAEGRVRKRDAGFNAYEEVAPTLDGGQPHSVGPVGMPSTQALDDRNQQVNTEVCHPLNGEAGMRSDAVLIGFQPNSSRTHEEWRAGESVPVRKASGGLGAVPPAVAGVIAPPAAASDAVVGSLGAHHGNVRADQAWTGQLLPSQPQLGVRRLTPLECERLMGWPDNHTKWAADGRELADSHRYRLCGNGVVSVVAEWVAHRLVLVDAWISADLAQEAA
jgi:DNA (cytosine-5)-methyltransferase 1